MLCLGFFNHLHCLSQFKQCPIQAWFLQGQHQLPAQEQLFDPSFLLVNIKTCPCCSCFMTHQRKTQSMNSQLLSAFISKSYSFHSNSQASLLRARTTVGSLSNQILMYYPKREKPLTPALLQRKGNSPTNKQWGEFSAEELSPFFRVFLQNYPFTVMFFILMGHITFPPLPDICEGSCISQQNHRDKDCCDCCQVELGKCSVLLRCDVRK